MVRICILVGLVIVLCEGRWSPPEEKCQFTVTHRMQSADCINKHLVSIPTYLATRNIEILEASVNRIRILKNDSFIGLEYLKFIYLFDNSITTIESATFYPLSYLEVLDLTLNSIRELPANMYLPSPLRKIYLSENLLKEVSLRTATSLTHLHLSSCKDLSHFPDLGVLPLLRELNLTGPNKVGWMNVTDFAGLCNLESLYLPNEIFQESKWSSSCDCVYVANWIYNHSIYVVPSVNCTHPGVLDPESECPKDALIEAERVFGYCQASYSRIAASHWVVVVCAVVGVILCLLLLSVLWRRKCRSKRRHSHSGGISNSTNLTSNSSNSASSARLKSSCDMEIGQNERKLLKDSSTKPRF